MKLEISWTKSPTQIFSWVEFRAVKFQVKFSLTSDQLNFKLSWVWAMLSPTPCLGWRCNTVQCNFFFKKGRIVWLSIVLASLSVALLFLTTATKDFANRAVVTTIETTTASLQVSELERKGFPSLIAIVFLILMTVRWCIEISNKGDMRNLLRRKY